MSLGAFYFTLRRCPCELLDDVWDPELALESFLARLLMYLCSVMCDTLPVTLGVPTVLPGIGQ
jgi:hypothetical protein